MTHEEFSLLIKGMRAIYSLPDFMNDAYTMEMWYSLLSDLPYEVASASLKNHMQTSNKIPTPADIRAGAVKLTQKDSMNANEAWALVSKAIRNSTYNSEKEYAKLPTIVQKAVGDASRLRQMAMDEDYNEAVQQSLFIKTYAIEQQREEQRRQISPDLLKLTQEVTKRLEAT